MLNIENHVAMKKSARVKEVAQELFDMSVIQYFCFQRHYPDGYYTFLASDIDFPKVFFESGHYLCSWIFTARFENLVNGCVPWGLQKKLNTDEQNEFDKGLIDKTGQSHGIDIIDKCEQHCDVYSFSSDDPKVNLCDAHVLQQFIFYFKQRCRSLIFEAEQDKFYVQRRDDIKTNLNIIDVGSVINETTYFDITQYYLTGEYCNVYLTKKELICLQMVIRGLSAKLIAKELELSFRTVEKHLDNIKSKLGTKQIIDAIRIAYENNLHLLDLNKNQ